MPSVSWQQGLELPMKRLFATALTAPGRERHGDVSAGSCSRCDILQTSDVIAGCPTEQLGGPGKLASLN